MPTRIIKNTLLEGIHNKPIVTDLCFNQNQIKKPVVVFCHGYKGYKDWGAFDLMKNEFIKHDVFLVKFNFSHNGGTPENPIDFPDLEAFGNNNFIKELDDLNSVLDWICENKEYSSEIDVNNIILIGHSRGGGITSIKASEDSRIKKLITWASVSDYGKRFPIGDELLYWKSKGVAFIENARTKQQMPHYFQFYENFDANRDRLHIQSAVEKLTIPHLIFHGSADETVPLTEAKNIHSWNPNSEFFLIEGATHSFGASQPWESKSLPEDFKIVLQKTFEFLET